MHFLNVSEIAGAISGDSSAQNTAYENSGLLASYKTSEIYLDNTRKLMVTPSRFVPDIKQEQEVDTLPVRECLENGKEISGEYDDYRGKRVFDESVCLIDEGLVLVIEVDKDEMLQYKRLLTLPLLAEQSRFSWVFLLLCSLCDVR